MQLLPTQAGRSPIGPLHTAALRQAQPSSKAQRARAVSRLRAAAPPAAVAAPAQPAPPPQAPTAPPPAAPISGAVFALPRIGIGIGIGFGFGFGTPSPSRWMSAPRSSAPSPAPAMLMPSQLAARALARSAEEAGRAQLVQALLLELNAIEVPQDIQQGRCTLHANTPALSCDPEPLYAALDARKAVLAGMLDAYRRLVSGEPAITLQAGHLRFASP